MSGKEIVPPEQPIPINLDLGTLHFSMTLGRQSILTDQKRAYLDKLGLDGFKFVEYVGELSEDEIREEFEAYANDSIQKSTYQIIGYFFSQEGFIRFNRPFVSLEDEETRNTFRAIVDRLLEEDLIFYHPADAARRAMVNSVDSKIGTPRYWEHDEIYAHLMLAFSERGKQFGEIGEHMDKHNPSIYWPGHIGRILDLAKKLGEGKISEDRKDFVKEIIWQDISLIMKFSGLKTQESLKIVNEVERIFGEGF